MKQPKHLRWSFLLVLASAHCGSREATMGSHGGDASTDAVGIPDSDVNDSAEADALDAGSHAPDALLDADALACGQYIEAGLIVQEFDGAPGGRMIPGMVPICCGRADEVPGLSCADLSVDGGEYGASGQCLGLNDMWDGKFVSVCCPGLARIQAFAVKTDAHPAPYAFMLETVDAARVTCIFTAGPSGVVCLPCGNGICEPPLEDICNCPQDCPR